MTSIFKYDNSFTLESGVTLPGYHLAYTTHGKLNADKSNVVWIFHALTANSNPLEWWPGLVGDGRFFDPAKYFIICVNKPGSPYGSISPLSINPQTNQPYYHDFPLFTIRDMVRTYQHLKDHLGISKIFIALGGSTGGMQLLEWAIEEPALFEHIVPIATNAILSPWGIAFNASQRMAIEADSSWLERRPDAGQKGLAAARSIALLSYRHYNGYDITQARDKAFVALHNEVVFASDNYQRYQGLKLVNRFNALCYYRLSQSMDSHDVGRKRGGVEAALQKITAKTLVIGIKSDVLYPIAEQEYLQKTIRGAELLNIASDFGHDGFLLEYEKIEPALRKFIEDKQSHHLKVVNE
ncbi:homoserine O-acetyltransferase family protein [Terrimonas pollutisoli]|uniref:homoserine O-acetyltransferase family protein n=1 Tax=Terrimonas pollutisoli TaxID=3034147 RepID=UPI0023EB50A4|nr:homoserine O-acetyltransferase [Terrimonas sp. H1YJ31]